jgi:GNAT superfamily N-acetyltransferase
MSSSLPPRYRRRGIARLLVKRALLKFAKMGVRRIHVNASVEVIAKAIRGLPAEQQKQVFLVENWPAYEKTLAQIMSESWGNLAVAVKALASADSGHQAETLSTASLH